MSFGLQPEARLKLHRFMQLRWQGNPTDMPAFPLDQHVIVAADFSQLLPEHRITSYNVCYTKLLRAYAARFLAKNVVAAELAERCTLQIAYAIGVPQPLALYVDTHGTGKLAESRISDILREVMDLSPRGIREHP